MPYRKQAARLETEVAEAEASAANFQQQLKEALCRVENTSAEAESARIAAMEAEVHSIEYQDSAGYADSVDCGEGEEVESVGSEVEEYSGIMYQMPFVSSFGSWVA